MEKIEPSLPITAMSWSWVKFIIFKINLLNFGWASSNTLGTNSILHHNQSKKIKNTSNWLLKVQSINYNTTSKHILYNELPSKWEKRLSFPVMRLEHPPFRYHFSLYIVDSKHTYKKMLHRTLGTQMYLGPWGLALKDSLFEYPKWVFLI